MFVVQNSERNSTNQNVPAPNNGQRKCQQKAKLPSGERVLREAMMCLQNIFGSQGVRKIGTLLFETFGQSAGFNSRLFQTNPYAF